jgi:Lecithin:cholesterol acyltransferase
LPQIGWFKRFQNLVEEAVEKNHGQPVVLIAHSMGNLVTYYFLKQVPCSPAACMYCLLVCRRLSVLCCVIAALRQHLSAPEACCRCLFVLLRLAGAGVQIEQDPLAELSSWTHRHVAGLISLAAPW